MSTALLLRRVRTLSRVQLLLSLISHYFGRQGRKIAKEWKNEHVVGRWKNEQVVGRWKKKVNWTLGWQGRALWKTLLEPVSNFKHF